MLIPQCDFAATSDFDYNQRTAETPCRMDGTLTAATSNFTNKNHQVDKLYLQNSVRNYPLSPMLCRRCRRDLAQSGKILKGAYKALIRVKMASPAKLPRLADAQRR